MVFFLQNTFIILQLDQLRPFGIVISIFIIFCTFINVTIHLYNIFVYVGIIIKYEEKINVILNPNHTVFTQLTEKVNKKLFFKKLKNFEV